MSPVTARAAFLMLLSCLGGCRADGATPEPVGEEAEPSTETERETDAGRGVGAMRDAGGPKGTDARVARPDAQAPMSPRDAGALVDASDTKAPNDAGPKEPRGDDAGALASTPGTFKVFDQLPQFGIFRASEPAYTPPEDVLMWRFGTVFAKKLGDAEKSQIGADLTARITYHAQCDNYDRLGHLFMLRVPHGELPSETTQRTELARFITPFSDYTQGALATYVFPAAELAAYANVLADPAVDVWVGIAGGSNPYAEDPCARGNRPAAFREVGFKYSLELASTKPLAPASSTNLVALYYAEAKQVPVTGTFKAESELRGTVSVIVSGHGAAAGGSEYLSTRDTVSVNGTMVGSFDTKVDCASYARFSPDGNQGIFRNNNGNNPRNWCPGALVSAHVFPAMLRAGDNQVSLGISQTRVPDGSYYATSISFSTP